VVTDEDEAAVLLVGGDTDAVAELDEAVGEAEERADVAVRADDEDADVERRGREIQANFRGRHCVCVCFLMSSSCC